MKHKREGDLMDVDTATEPQLVQACAGGVADTGTKALGELQRRYMAEQTKYARAIRTLTWWLATATIVNALGTVLNLWLD